MKSAVETLGPTRVKLTVEVPFDELKPAVDKAYKTVSQQVTIKGFRKGHVPPTLVDQYVGRGAVLEQAINDALPELYGEAIRENEVDILGQPEIEVTELTDGDQLIFTAEVDVRPEIELPDLEGIAITVEDAEVPEEEVDTQISNLRDRFATLTTAERAAADGDYVSIDLVATVNGEPVEDASATNLSYQVGSDSLVRGLDEAIIGLAAGESKDFETQLVAGDFGGETAQTTVTVKGVKAKELPELDDDFAQTASEFDTLEELKADLRNRLSRVRQLTQANEARDNLVKILLEKIEVPVPEHVLEDEVSYRLQSLDQQLQQIGATREFYAEAEGIEVDAIETDMRENAAEAIKAQFVLDAIARKESLEVSEAELTETIVRRAAQSGVRADQYAQQVVAQGALGQLMGEVLRSKALANVLERAKITDASGREVDLDALLAPPVFQDADDDEDEDDELGFIEALDDDDDEGDDSDDDSDDDEV